ncbi:hypothetical protein DFH11DRAFT_1515778 [Phellopilus nigrolimitatus]|nr:hypothetical protein DFH11DRAFT_1515778 [Phellopilus nigrolimitatus]
MCRIEELFPTLRRDKPREFDARFTNSAPANAPVQCLRKPDMVLLDQNDAKKEVVAWNQIRCTWELKVLSEPIAPAQRKKVFEQLLQSARLIFASQSNRRFVCGMTMLNDDAKFYIFDRTGVISSESFNIHMEPEKFLRAVLGFFLADDTDIGLDPSIMYEGGKRFMTVAGIKYEIQREIYVESCIRGRGTVCFLALHDDKEYVIKDSWVDNSRQVFEHEMLERVKHVDGIHGTMDTTAIDRAFLNDPEIVNAVNPVLKNEWMKAKKKAETREHQRIVIEPFGERLENFSCLYELVLAVRTIIWIIEKLADEGVLHRDISLRNIILAKQGGDFRKALLIDFDYAIDLETQLLGPAKGNRTGTLPFMAIEVMQSNDDGDPMFPHAYYHDLESLFYILCWICTILEGPYNKERKTDAFDFGMSEITKWAGLDIPNAKLDHIWRGKQGIMNHVTSFKRLVSDQVAPYFSDLKDCLLRLRATLFPNQEEDIETLEDAIKSVEEEMKKAPEDRSKSTLAKKKFIPLSRRKRDELFADLYKILDDTLTDLKNTGKDQPEVRPPELDRTPNAFLDGLVQNAASRVKFTRHGKDGKKEETIEEEDEDIDMSKPAWLKTSAADEEENGDSSGDEVAELVRDEGVNKALRKVTSGNYSLSAFPLNATTSTSTSSKRGLEDTEEGDGEDTDAGGVEESEPKRLRQE